MIARKLTNDEVIARARAWPTLKGVKCSLVDEMGQILQTRPMARLKLVKMDGHTCGEALDVHFFDLPLAKLGSILVHQEDAELFQFTIRPVQQIGPARDLTIEWDKGPRRIFRLPEA